MWNLFRKRLPYRVSAKSWLWVTLQFFCLAYLASSAPLLSETLFGLIPELTGILIAMAGLLKLNWRSFSVFPEPRPDGKLETGGIYAFIRHPMYAGILLLFLVLVIEYPSILRITALLLLGMVFIIKIRLEEAWLASRYPEFADWSKSSDRLIPFIW